MKKEHFPALTGIRFIAASMVFFCHYPFLVVSATEAPFLFYLLRQLNVGVNLFFVLSGFLITFRYYDVSLKGSGMRSYMTKRFVRIFPLYLVLLGVFFAFQLRQGKTMGLFEILLNVSLLKGLSSQYIFSGIAQSWSLTVEEMFYAFAPLSFWLIRNRRFFFWQVPVLLSIGVLLVVYFRFFPVAGFFGSYEFMLSATFFGRCFEFFTGVYLALLWQRKGIKPLRYRYFTFSGGLLFLVLLFCLSYYAYRTGVEATNKTPWGILFFNLAIPVAIGLTYLGLLSENTWFRKALSSAPVVLLGRSSYAFYLLHLGFIAEVIYFHVSSHWLLLYSSLQLMSVLLYLYFEKPVYVYLRRWLTHSRSSALQTKAVLKKVL